MYKIRLKDGTLIENLKLNGNNFISSEEINSEIFTDDALKEVEIIGPVEKEDGTLEEETTTYYDMFLVQILKMVDQIPFKDGDDEEKAEWWFILAEKTKAQLEKERLDELFQKTDTSITDIEIALVDVYEMILGGM